MEEILEKIVNEENYIKAAAIVDEEGLIIDKFSRENAPFDIEELASIVITPYLRLSESFTDVKDDEHLEEMVAFLTNHIILIYKLAYETYIVVVLDKTPLYGKVRFIVKKYLPKLKESL